MKQFNLNKVMTILGLFILLLLTYFRENLLLEINARLTSEVFDRSNSYWFLDFFKTIRNEELLKWKWGLTMLFSIVMSFVTIGSLYSWFKSLQLLKIVGIVYLILFSIVCILAIIGYSTNSFNDIYFVLRKILGIVQSPLPFFVLFALFYWDIKKVD